MENTTQTPTVKSDMAGFNMPDNSAETDRQFDELDDLDRELESGDVRGTSVSAPDTKEKLGITEDSTREEVRKAAKDMTYEERVKAFDLSLDDAAIIVDSLVSKGEYTETVKLSKSTTVILSTRSTKFNSYVSKMVDQEGPRYTGRMSQLMSEYQLAGAIIRYGDQVLPELDKAHDVKAWEDMVATRLDFVQQIQGPIFLSLCTKQAKFDAKMMVVFSEGYDENF